VSETLCPDDVKSLLAAEVAPFLPLGFCCAFFVFPMACSGGISSTAGRQKRIHMMNRGFACENGYGRLCHTVRTGRTPQDQRWNMTYFQSNDAALNPQKVLRRDRFCLDGYSACPAVALFAPEANCFKLQTNQYFPHKPKTTKAKTLTRVLWSPQ